MGIFIGEQPVIKNKNNLYEIARDQGFEGSEEQFYNLLNHQEKANYQLINGVNTVNLKRNINSLIYNTIEINITHLDGHTSTYYIQKDDKTTFEDLTSSSLFSIEDGNIILTSSGKNIMIDNNSLSSSKIPIKSSDLIQSNILNLKEIEILYFYLDNIKYILPSKFIS